MVCGRIHRVRKNLVLFEADSLILSVEIFDL
jgi:hypothetical protein